MVTHYSISDAGRLYIGAVCAAGIAVVLHALYTLATSGIGYQWYILAGLTLLSGSFTIRIPTIPARLSVSETFVFAAVILFGPAAATIIVVLDSLIISLWLRKSARFASRLLFNMAAPAIAIWTASHAFFYTAGVQPLSLAPRPILSLVAPLLLLALLYFLLNSWLIAGAVGFDKHVSPFVVWRDNFLWLSLNYFSGASVAALLLPYLQADEYAFIRVAGILLPILLISYLTFKTALGRVEDANRHLSELNRLYLSTIETLAMAIDAKDQITHGHIRRVQHYAVGLARKLGVVEGPQIRAMEAASLLHDMGKLAVPEYILNKPGKLTPAEFEKMKLHASVGADILSAIEFPYPVVPIVRHHHENWDGTGYPDGLKGSDIPIGARILSVVDCYDALTSDRPYRPRLSDAEAIKILVERRGTMYDPLVVDTFVSVHIELAPQNAAVTPEPLAGVPADIRQTEHGSPGLGLDYIAASTEEVLVLFDLARSLTSNLSTADYLEIVSRHLRRVVPASTCVFYVYDPGSDILTASHAVGEHSAHFTGLQIPRGQRLTGWVAANRQTIFNSDPVLDLGEVARVLKPRLYTCLSTPLIYDEMLVGVLSLYSTQRDAFNEDHRRIAEAVARQIALTFRQSSTREMTGPHGPRLAASVYTAAIQTDPNDLAVTMAGGSMAVILIDVRLPRSPRGDDLIDELIPYVAQLTRRALRSNDALLRFSRSELVALLSETGQDTAVSVVRRVAQAVRERSHWGNEAGAESLRVKIGLAASPEDGTDLDNLLSTARLRAQSSEDSAQGSVSIH